MEKSVIFVVDDDPNNFDVIDTLLDIENCELHYSSSGQEAIDSLDLIQPDLILLDVMLPGIDGIEACRHIKAISQYNSVPVIMVTALTSKQDLAKCFKAGAEDFISKPINRFELNARVGSLLKIRLQHQKLIAFNQNLEIAVQKKTRQLRTVIIQDTLTQLPSKAYLTEVLTKKLASSGSPLALVIIYCNQLNLVNSSFGYSFGEQLLIAIAGRLEKHVNPEDILVRLKEDCFGLLLTQISEPNISEIEPLLQKLTKSFEHSFSVAGCEIFMTALMGVAFSGHTIKTPAQLIQAADTAIYQTKRQGKGNIQLFCPQMHAEIQNRLILETELQKAVENLEFVTFYQPIINLKTLELNGFEALIRWQHPQKGIILPGDFVPSMETSGLIIPVGMMILRQACEQLKTLHLQGQSSLTMSVNISARQFASPNLLADINQILDETNVNPACLKLEITESALLDNIEEAIAITQELRSRQIKICIDDFGTGYSSLGYLDRFPANYLKIDQSFVGRFTQKQNNYPIVNTIISLAKQLGLSIVAEGIETEYQLTKLQKLKCDFGQGYFFSKPLSSDILQFQSFS